MNKDLKLIFDSEANMAYISLKHDIEGNSHETITVDNLPGNVGEINLDFDKEGKLISIEFGMASELLPNL